MLILFSAGILLTVLVDQATKYVAFNTLRFSDSVNIIDGVLRLTYCENRGAAFGILQNQFWLFFIITIVFLSLLVFFIVKKKPKSPLLIISLMLLAGGAIGNFIDRLFRGFVVDFLDFCLINFPIFNVADCFVVIGAILLGVYILFFSPDSFSEKKKNDETN